jgi:hypothetical protein
VAVAVLCQWAAVPLFPVFILKACREFESTGTRRGKLLVDTSFGRLVTSAWKPAVTVLYGRASRSVVFNLLCSLTPRYNLSSALYPQSCWYIIQVILYNLHLLWLTLNLAQIIQCLSWNYIYNFTYPLRCLRVPPDPSLSCLWRCSPDGACCKRSEPCGQDLTPCFGASEDPGEVGVVDCDTNFESGEGDRCFM